MSDIGMLVYCEECNATFMESKQLNYYLCEKCKAKQILQLQALEEKNKMLHVHECEMCGDPYSSDVKWPTYNFCENCLNPSKSVVKKRPEKAIAFTELAEERYKMYLPSLDMSTRDLVYSEGYERIAEVVRVPGKKEMLQISALSVISKAGRELGLDFKDIIREFARQGYWIRAHKVIMADLKMEMESNMREVIKVAEEAAYIFALMAEGHKFKEDQLSLLTSGTVDDIDDDDMDDEELYGPRLAQIG